jgi:hypothetical protein
MSLHKVNGETYTATSITLKRKGHMKIFNFNIKSAQKCEKS